MRTPFIVPVLALSLAVAPTVAEAQLIGETPERPVPPRGFVSFGLKGAQPLQDFADYIKVGFGFGGHVSHALDPQRIFSVRATVNYLIYGHDTERYSVYGGALDITTSNNILSMGIGPQLMAPGPGVRPYVNGTYGFSYFSTGTELKWRYADEAVDSWTDFSDAVTAWTGGGGLLIPLGSGTRPVLLDLGATYHGNGEAEYLREGSISRDESGETHFTPIRSRTNMVVYTIGISIGAW